MKYWSIMTPNPFNCSFESLNSCLNPNTHLFIIPQLNCVCYMMAGLSSLLHPSCLRQATHHCLHCQRVRVPYMTDRLAKYFASVEKKNYFPKSVKTKQEVEKSNQAKPKTTVKVCFFQLWLMSSPEVFYQHSINISTISGTLPQSVLKVNGQTATEHELSFCTSSSDQGLSFYLPVQRRELCLLIAAHDYNNQAKRGEKKMILKKVI